MRRVGGFGLPYRNADQEQSDGYLVHGVSRVGEGVGERHWIVAKRNPAGAAGPEGAVKGRQAGCPIQSRFLRLSGTIRSHSSAKDANEWGARQFRDDVRIYFSE